MATDAELTILGGTIAGLVGLVAVWAQQLFQERTWLSDNILGPELDQARRVAETGDGWQHGMDAWPATPWHLQKKVRKALRELFNDLSAASVEFEKARATYSNFMSTGLEGQLSTTLSEMLRPYTSGGDSIDWARIGVEGLGQTTVTAFYQVVSREMIRNPGGAESAWRRIDAIAGASWPVDRLIATIRKEDPDLLVRINTTFTADPRIEKARDLLLAADAKRLMAREKAIVVSKLLSHRFPWLRLVTSTIPNRE